MECATSSWRYAQDSQISVSFAEEHPDSDSGHLGKQLSELMMASSLVGEPKWPVIIELIAHGPSSDVGHLDHIGAIHFAPFASGFQDGRGRLIANRARRVGIDDHCSLLSECGQGRQNDEKRK